MPAGEIKRIFLSPPCVGEEERAAVARAFDSGYVAPCGPMVDEFERRLALAAGRSHAVVLASGTAALDLAMEEWGVDGSWTVFAPTLTFVATVGPAWHRGARLVFVDSDATGNIDVERLREAMEAEDRGRRMMAIGVDLYGRPCDYEAITALASRFGAVFVSDSAEAVGARRGSVAAGGAGDVAIYSFNGNKIVTTSGGGALLTDDAGIASRARSRSQQSREPFPWYEHREVGYNYRMSNILASVGLAQLAKTGKFVERRREILSSYKSALSSRFGFLPPVDGENHWLSVALAADAKERDAALARLAAANIEARPVWKPMHLQPVFTAAASGRVSWFGGSVAEDLFARGICLPSGSGMSGSDIGRVVDALMA